MLPKEIFPRLLKSLCDAVAPDSKSDKLVSGFKKCGIFPWNPEEVLCRFPKEPNENNNTNSSHIVSDVVINMLKNMRYGEKDTSARKRSKIDVAPGKSITFEDLTPQNDSPSTSNGIAKKTLANKKASKIKKGSSEESNSNDSDKISYMDSSEDEDLLTIVQKEREALCFSSSQESDSSASDSPKSSGRKSNICPPLDSSTYSTSSQTDSDSPVYKFVLVEFKYNEGTKKETKKVFVSKIISKDESCFKVSCLRRYGQKPSTFIFPQVEDITSIDCSQIKCTLKNPTTFRGRFTFHEDLGNI